MASSAQPGGATSLAGRLKNRLRRSVQHDSGGHPAQPQFDDSASESGASRPAVDGGDSEDSQPFELVSQTGEQPPQTQPDLDDCAELSELLMTAADEEQLRAQLISLAIENETLRARAVQEETDLVNRLRRQLSDERAARLRAETAASDAAAAAGAVSKSASGGPIFRAVAGLRRRRQARVARAAAAAGGAIGGVVEGVEAAAAAVDDAEIESLDSDSDAEADDAGSGHRSRRRRPESFCNRVKAWTTAQLLDLIEDLQQPADSERTAAAAEEPQLSARRLKANASRFGRNSRPLTRCLRGLRGVLQWRSPSYTALVIAMYCFALRYDMLLPLLLLLCISRLSLNYLKYRLHWNFEFNFVSDYEPADDEDAAERERTVGTQVNMVVQVARKVQNLAATVSDNMEKFKNLVTWRSPKHTQMLLNGLVVAFAFSLAFPSSTCLQVVGLYLGIKLFIIDALVARYPRLRRRFDRAAKLWRALPTDQQLGSLQVSGDVEKYILPASDDDASGVGRSASPASGEEPSPPLQQQQPQLFSQAFSLPATEFPLPRWRGGKRCAIVCKDAERSLPLPSWLKHGKLFLTRSFLCFERSKDRGKAKRRNLVIPLAMIRWIKKTKPFAWLPGGGMSIEVQIFGVEKPLTFGAIIGRDEVFESLMDTGKRAGLAWAGAVAPDDGQQPPQADPQLVQSVNQALMSDSDLED